MGFAFLAAFNAKLEVIMAAKKAKKPAKKAKKK